MHSTREPTRDGNKPLERYHHRPSTRRRRSSRGFLVAVAVVLGWLSLGVDGALNADCTLVVPASPLTAVGLATPFQLRATKTTDGPCNQANDGQTTFVQGAIIDTDTGAISVYNPLVIDAGSAPAVPPTVPTLPTNYVAALWFGTNTRLIRLAATITPGSDSLEQGFCVGGGGSTEHSPFGQFAHCNAPAFFAAARRLIQMGKLIPPPLGKSRLGDTCPTTRDFSIVDADPSDNVVTSYLVSNSKLAQDTPANRKKLTGPLTVLDNGSDNRLLAAFVDPAIGCGVWTVPDLADTTNPPQQLAALPLHELQAAVYQPAPQALVIALDPMVLRSNGAADLAKLNAYRVGVGQAESGDVNDALASTSLFCNRIYALGAPRIWAEQSLTRNRTSPDTAVGVDLFTFLVGRFEATITTLDCPHKIGMNSPFVPIMDANGVVTSASLDRNNVAAAQANVESALFNTDRSPPTLAMTMTALSALDMPVVGANNVTTLPLLNAAADATSTTQCPPTTTAASSGTGSGYHFDLLTAATCAGIAAGVLLVYLCLKRCKRNHDLLQSMPRI